MGTRPLPNKKRGGGGGGGGEGESPAFPRFIDTRFLLQIKLIPSLSRSEIYVLLLHNHSYLSWWNSTDLAYQLTINFINYNVGLIQDLCMQLTITQSEKLKH